MNMAHSSNGKHQRIAIETAPGRTAVQKAVQSTERTETSIAEMHEVVLAKSSAFIREHPGASLSLRQL